MPRYFACSRYAQHVFFMLCAFFVVLAYLITTTDSSFATDPSTLIYTTSQVENKQPSTEPSNQFDCSDRIYLVVESDILTHGEHILQVSWIDPADQQRELTRYTFTAVPAMRVWSWLELDGSSGAFIGQLFDPSFGMESFVGNWRAKVSIDGKQVGDLSFKVLC